MRPEFGNTTIVVVVVLLLAECLLCYGKESTITAVFVFGDSTVDPGNNNYLPTIARGNFPPYGRDFINHIPTGRFSNGRLVTDFIASFAGVKENLPPYLDPSLTIEDLMTGVSFASAGAGFDDVTSQISSALTQSQQLDMFKGYKAKLEAVIGKEKTDNLVRNAGYIVSSGTNDFTFNYYGPSPARRQTYTISSYQDFVWQKIEKFIQDLLDEGAMKIGVVGVPPIGCLPAIITLNSKNPVSNRQCIERLNALSRNYNQMLKNNLSGLQRKDTKVVYGDIYTPIINMVQAPTTQYGFEQVHKGCCGTGLIEADFLCNPKSALCDDVLKYVFWDAFHPTQKGYSIIFDSLRPLIQDNIL